MEVPLIVSCAGAGMLMSVQIEIGIVSPVKCVEEVVHRTRVIVTELAVFEAGETGEVEDSVVEQHRLEMGWCGGWRDASYGMLSLGGWVGGGSLLNNLKGFYTQTDWAMRIILWVAPSEPLIPACPDRGSQALGNPIDCVCLDTCFLLTTKDSARAGWRTGYVRSFSPQICNSECPLSQVVHEREMHGQGRVNTAAFRQRHLHK
ncbi:hypothetical protein BDM02DRAFT_3011327 [Thelephora ganbajun]|uniref:Uncharacterized protein n=1 Tax=Thelephora ganbajun TaxID=370292 RepID=A0ACB6Z9P5_THEGA|nr:hypothetical protein BDM02DRAFT_3011327 [Thelephora ganbajun]